MLGERLPSLTAGEHSVEFDLFDMHLGPGQYHLHAALAHYGGGEIHRLPEAAHFSVDSDETTIGVLPLKAKLVSVS